MGEAVKKDRSEIRETAAERMAADIDDTRSGQHQLIKTDMPEIERILVDEILPPEWPAGACCREIFLAQRAECVRRDMGEHAGIIGAVLAAERVFEAPRQEPAMRHFASPFDGWVTGQDMFEQRRAAALHADDKNGLGGFRAAAGTRRKEF